ncbi:hypothetical protein [Rhizobium mongolense]|uniref:hypothetical protein n=1 Tax=Rhizobium mongolense TaxID=57676 RepID=UPI0034A2F3AF
MRGAENPNVKESRYVKFSWNHIDHLPALGVLDYQPKAGAFRMYREGFFSGQALCSFPAIKEKRKLAALGCCAYCGRTRDPNGKLLELTSEHVIPEFLGAGLELPEASCADCQTATSGFENSIAQEMFDPVRKVLLLKGKGGLSRKLNFPLDVGRETTDRQMIPVIHYPTVLVMPGLYPASSYSNRPFESNGLFNFMMYNINAEAAALAKYDVETASTQSVDLARFCQMVAKIGLVYAANHFGRGALSQTLADFIRTPLPPQTPSVSHFNHVGGLWQQKAAATHSLHEIEVGHIEWNGGRFAAARVQLFACYGMPSYYVTVGRATRA